MLMNKKILAVALLSLAGTSAALAAPQESFNYVTLNGGNLVGDALQGGAGNSVVTATATGSYTVRSARLAGNVAAWGAGTYGSETRIRVTTANGGFVTFGPFSPLNSTPGGPVSFDISLNITPQTAAGSWTVETYETYNDGSVDATYDQVNLTLDDAALPVGAPDTFTDLGDFTLVNRTVDQTINLAADNEVRWFKLKLPSVNGVGVGYIDIFTTNIDPTQPVAANELDDDDLALYSAVTAGLIAYDDLSGPGFFGQLSFGSGTPARPATVISGQGAGATFTGVNGTLSEGFYYLALGQYNMAHPTDVSNNWGSVTSSAAGGRLDTVLHIRTQLNNAPYPPTGTGAANPATVLSGSSTLLTVTVLPGGNPASTGISVHGDLSGLGGSATQLFYDDGTHGDAASGDGVFSFSYAVASGAADGTATVPFSVTDAQSRSSSGSLSFGIDAAGDLPATAMVPSGSGALDSLSGSLTANDVDMFKISICDTANFTATTFGGTDQDTQLFLFNLDGTGVVMNDDIPDGQEGDTTLQSRISGALVPAAGNYYLAVAHYDMDPISGGAEMWADTPYNAERTPDGAGSSGAVEAWNGANAVVTPYTIAMTGACYPSGGNICGAADVGGVGGVAGADNHLDNNDFVVFIDFFFNHNPIADQGSTGGAPGADGAWDNNDFVVFIDNFFTAPASCR
jgi:hypothetical protein